MSLDTNDYFVIKQISHLSKGVVIIGNLSVMSINVSTELEMMSDAWQMAGKLFTSNIANACHLWYSKDSVF